jgi:hypothetical protein
MQLSPQIVTVWDIVMFLLLSFMKAWVTCIYIRKDLVVGGSFWILILNIIQLLETLVGTIIK